MKIAIIGFAGQGKSSYEYWDDGTNEITICDRDISLQLPEGAVSQLGPNYLKNLHIFDLIIRTPALHPREIVNANPEYPDILAKVTSNTNEFLKVCSTKNIVGVTGTKGKGTTSTLITLMLRAAGRTVYLGGNIGIPPLVMLKNNIQADDWVVLELANFQLLDLKYSPPLATVLMVEPEHLDWHTDLAEYIFAKQRLVAYQQTSDKVVYYGRNEISLSVAEVSIGEHIPFLDSPGAQTINGEITIDGHVICRTDELKMLGEHNWQNACAAVTTVWQIVQDVSAIRSVLTTFAGLPFRIEFRREANGVQYYNDSFASVGAATAAAIKSIKEMKVLIIGGYDRMLNLQKFAQAVATESSQIRHTLLIGQSADRMAENLSLAGYGNFTISRASNMTDIVEEARQLAVKGDAVLLSPGFPSFDMFKNFEDRGKQFNAVVASL